MLVFIFAGARLPMCVSVCVSVKNVWRFWDMRDDEMDESSDSRQWQTPNEICDRKYEMVKTNEWNECRVFVSVAQNNDLRNETE